VAKQTGAGAAPIPQSNSGGQSPPLFAFSSVRTRVLDSLTQDDGRPKVVSVVAPIGYGKTVLMSELHAHLQAAGEQCFWIGLDDRHDSIERVLHAIDAALAAPGDAFHPMYALFQGDEPIEGRVAKLIDALTRLAAPATIFIDNLNSCRDETLNVFLDAMIFSSPPSVRFVWSSTNDPGFNVGRARVEGLLRQIGLKDLSLNAEETHALLGERVHQIIGATGIETILHRTEGWPAAVRLAQIVLDEAEQPAATLETFSGTDEDVVALLNRQVLKAFTPALRDFLLRIAHLRSFDLDLCRHVSGIGEADKHIDYLVRHNVFIIPLDRNRRQYRLHGLFREYLLDEAKRSLDAEANRNLLLRAAEWSRGKGDWQDAIEYTLAAGDSAAASALLDQTATFFVRDRGDTAQYIRWIEHLLAMGVEIGWEAHFWYVWALIFHRRYAHSLAQHERLAERVRNEAGKAGTLPAEFPPRIDHLRICIDLFTDRLDDAYQGVERWLATENAKDAYSFASVCCIKSICLASAFEFAQARQTMRIAEPVLRDLGGAYSIGWVHLIHGTLFINEGDYTNAWAELSAGLVHLRQSLGNDALLTNTMAFVAALCAVEMGHDDEARALLLPGLRTAHSHELVGTTAFGFDAAIKLWNGENDEPVPLAHLHAIAGRYPPRLSLMLSCYIVRRLVRLGRLQEALDAAARIGLTAEALASQGNAADEFGKLRYRDLRAASAIDLLVATRRFKQAESMIEEEIRTAQADGRTARLVELGLAKVEIAMHAGNATAAARELAFAVSRAARRQIVRPFRDRAAIVAGLVNDTKPSSWSFTRTEERAFFARICEGLPVGDSDRQGWSAVRGADRNLTLVPTRREAELLSLLDLGLSNQQIAERSNVSITTVKWHLKNLYRKFGVSNRSAALAQARALNLLQRE